MNMPISKSALIWIIVALIVLVAVVVVVRLWRTQTSGLPEGIASGNGRIEAQLLDIAAKEPLRVEQILVAEGDLVEPGEVLVRLNTETLEAELTQALSNEVAAQEAVTIAQAEIERIESEMELAAIEARRARRLFESGAGSRREYEAQKTRLETTMAAMAQAEARLQEAREGITAAQASVTAIQARINDATLVSPVIGRVLYRLAEPGEVLGAGGKALTLVDLSDVYMEIFLPSNQAAALELGSEARIVMDYLPDWALPAAVSFVSPEAQFTPKQVETRNEREMLMFRVKLQIPHEIVLHYIEQIKTGIRGMGYVKLDSSARWPRRLQNILTTERDSLPPPGKP